MRLDDAVRAVKRWIEKYDYCHDLIVDRESGRLLYFSAKTTTTRASSMVSRISTIVEEVLGEGNFEVFKVLVGDPPADRGDLANWEIAVHLPGSRRRAA